MRSRVRGAAKPGRAGAGLHHRRDFVGGSASRLVLGDNIFYGHDLPSCCSRPMQRRRGRHRLRLPRRTIPSATAWSSSTPTAGRRRIEEKPAQPKSQLGGDRPVLLRRAASSTIAARSSLRRAASCEITDLNSVYLERGHSAGRARSAAATPGSTPARTTRCWRPASSSARSRSRQGLKVASPEEIAYRQGWIDRRSFEEVATKLSKTKYGRMLLAQLHSHDL